MKYFMRLAFEEYGKGDPIILLHAFPFSRKMWGHQIDAVVLNNLRLILPDLPGFGDSPISNEINSMENMALNVSELMKSLNIQEAIIGGLSMGGYVAINLFRLFPEKFKALILCDTNVSEDTDEIRTKRFELIKDIEKNGMNAVVEKVLPNLLSSITLENSSDLYSELANEILNANEKGTISALRGMANRKNHKYLLENIKIPTLLIFGEDDKITNLQTAVEIKEQITNSKLEIIKNCGHLSNLEQPSKFNRILIKFLNFNFQ